VRGSSSPRNRGHGARSARTLSAVVARAPSPTVSPVASSIGRGSRRSSTEPPIVTRWPVSREIRCSNSGAKRFQSRKVGTVATAITRASPIRARIARTLFNKPVSVRFRGAAHALEDAPALREPIFAVFFPGPCNGIGDMAQPREGYHSRGRDRQPQPLPQEPGEAEAGKGSAGQSGQARSHQIGSEQGARRDRAPSRGARREEARLNRIHP